MSVNATGLGELLGMPDLSVQTAIRPGIPASVPDFLSIMAMKSAPLAKDAVPSLAVGLPSAGDGNPTTEDAQAAPLPGAAIDQTDEGADMAFDLQLPAMPAQQSSVAGPKTPAARFPAIAARQLAAADAQVGSPATQTPETDAAVSACDTETEDDTAETPSISPGAIADRLPVPPAAPVVVAAPVTGPAVEVEADADADAGATAASSGPVDAARVAVAGEAMPKGASSDDAAVPAPALPNVANAAPDAQADDAAPLPVTNTTANAPAAPGDPAKPHPAQTMHGELRAAIEAVEKGGHTLHTRDDRADPETQTVPAPLREAIPASQTAQAVLAAIHDPVSARPQVADAAQGQIVSNEAVLDDLLIGNAVEDQWVDQLAADVETLVKGDHREARLHLKPRELGDLFIRLETNGNQAKVHFTVETAAAQGFIADAAPRLQSMMENRGVRLEEASVDVGSGRQDRGEQPRETAFEQPLGARPRGAASQVETVRAIVRQTAIERFA
jgi:flagellar hook-length control protein FliK